MKFPTLKTERLLLREVSNNDEKDMIENLSNLKVTKWLLVVPYPYTKKDARWWIKHSKEKYKDKKRNSYEFAIALKEGNKYIGGIGLTKIDLVQETGSLGYWLGEKYWRKGYGSEALDAVLKFAFNELKLRRLEAGVVVGNPSSGKLLEKFGAKLEGMKRKGIRCKSDNKIKDENIYGLLKEEWKRL